jgi:uncharacterized OsmC-like protein
MAEDIQVKREITLEADAETLERMRKEGHARGFTVYCDEAERIGGDNSAPPPLAYFGLSLAFWLLTQISRYGEMMKTKIDKAKVFVTARFKSEGSVLRETVQAVGLGFETRCELESAEAPEKVAAVVRNAEKGCYVMQTILQPTPVERRFTLNGAVFEPDQFQRPQQ